MLKLILNGCGGRMGRTVAALAAQKDGFAVVAGVDAYMAEAADFPVYTALEQVRERADAVVDFSNRDAVTPLLEYLCAQKLPAVIATTGHTPEGRQQILDASQKTAIFYSANLSLGVNVLLRLAKNAASILASEFDIEIVEKHHNQKLDAPSGTAMMLADGISAALENAPEYVFGRHDRHAPRGENEIGISALRGGSIVGEHDVVFAGPNEVLTLSHTAYSREIFAAGALRAAKFIAAREAGLFNMEHLMESLL